VPVVADFGVSKTKMVNALAVAGCLVGIAAFSKPTAVQAFYLPGGSPQSFKEGDM
jgi:hypothetical protein